MIKNFLSLLFVLLVVPATGYADKQNIAIDVVACINSAKGYPDTLDGAPWELAQAILEIPYDHERVRLAPDYYFVGGRTLGWHGTWAAFLHLGNNEWVAFETRAEGDELAVFGASFVPNEIVDAFAICGVDWGGHWIEDYPLLEVTTEQGPVAPLATGPLLNGDDLLPPKPKDQWNELPLG